MSDQQRHLTEREAFWKRHQELWFEKANDPSDPRTKREKWEAAAREAQAELERQPAPSPPSPSPGTAG